MGKNEIARELIADGIASARVAKLLVRLAINSGDRALITAAARNEALCAARCALLQEAACHPEAGLEPEISTLANEPKGR